MPSLLIPVATIEKCKQINSSNSLHVSDVIINYSWEKWCDFVNAVFPTLKQGQIQDFVQGGVQKFAALARAQIQISH